VFTVRSGPPFQEAAQLVRGQFCDMFGVEQGTARDRANSEQFPITIAAILPELGTQECLRLAAVIRCLLSAQAWLRMREEFGVSGDDSGPVVAWVLDAIVNEVHRGNLPP
jgi:hypothetical protein